MSPRWRGATKVLGCAAAGAGFALAAPPTNVYPALWLGMAALAWLLGEAGEASNGGIGSTAGVGVGRGRAAGARRWMRRAFEGSARGLFFGLAANVVALRFVPGVIVRFTPLPWAAGALALLLLGAFEGLRWMAAAIACRACIRLGVPRWAAFPVGIFAGTFVSTVFPWSAAGGVTPWPAMVQLADVVGERGVTALMALSAALLAEGARAALPGGAFARSRDGGPFVRAATLRKALPAAGFALAIPLATLAYGALRIRAIDAMEASAPRVSVGLVEPSIGATDRWDPRNGRGILAVLTALTARAEAQGADLVVWPEASYPFPVAHASRRAPIGDKAILAPGVHGPVLTGLILRGAADETYNSAAVAARDGSLSEPQDKLALLWFGETVPFADRSDWVRRTFARGVGLSAGKSVVLQRAGPVRAAVLNCFEDTLPSAGRAAMRGADDADETQRGPPNLLVNVTNDAWFAGSAESELHLRLAALRAVEERRDLVRAVNHGPTTWIDAAGRVRARWDPVMAGVLMARPALIDGGTTLYARAGDWPVAFGLAAAIIIVVVARRRAAHKREEGAAGKAGAPS